MQDRQPVKLGLSTIWCHCDGLILLSNHDGKDYVLWNPSTGTWRNLHCPYPVLSSTLIGICYDPLVKDFKVVVRNHPQLTIYAVYYCKTNSWIKREERDTTSTITNVPFHYGIPFEGSIYWISWPGKNSVMEYFVSMGETKSSRFCPG